MNKFIEIGYAKRVVFRVQPVLHRKGKLNEINQHGVVSHCRERKIYVKICCSLS